jgi:hypothetical protein
VKDPWRIVDPLTPAKDVNRINPGDRDVDWDFQPFRSCVLRFKACAIEVSSRTLQTEKDALELLAQCVLALKRSKDKPVKLGLWAAGVHAKWGTDLSDEPRADSEAKYSRIECETVVLWFADVGIDHGMLGLTRALVEAQRNPKLAPILKKHGIVPMLRS